MQISIFAVGRMKNGAEKTLSQHYLDRFAKIAPPIGLVFAGLREIVESKAPTAPQRRRQEGDRLKEVLSPSTRLILLDEKGKDFSSPQFADWLALRRDSGDKAALFALGGPDGHDEDMRQNADLLLSFGRATWPHQIARILLAEQLYRAATLLSGHPYHRH